MNKYLLKIFIIVAICYFNVMSGSTAVAQVKTDTSKTWISKEGKLVSLHYSYDSTELGKNFELLEFRNGQAEHKRVLLKDILMRLMTTVDNLEKNRSRYELIIDVGALKEKYLQAAEVSLFRSRILAESNDTAGSVYQITSDQYGQALKTELSEGQWYALATFNSGSMSMWAVTPFHIEKNKMSSVTIVLDK